MDWGQIDVEKNIKLFLDGNGKKNKGRNPNERYSSFDYCFNYFQSFREKNKIQHLSNKENLQVSCLHIGFYLASCGMLRGSSFLLERSVKYYEDLIYILAESDKKIWEIDIGAYTDENIGVLLSFRDKIKTSLTPYEPSDTLTTKIMLGVFANVPAYDQYVRKTFDINTFNKNSLRRLEGFYNYGTNKETIDTYSKKTKTLTFDENESSRRYTKAKIVDMIGFSASLPS